MLRHGAAFLALLSFGFLTARLGTGIYFIGGAIGIGVAALCLLSLRLMPTSRLDAAGPTGPNTR